jgi:putative tryptophan/tyrosine transport system substrate-binding protein
VGGSHGNLHRTAKIYSHARRRGSAAACSACAAKAREHAPCRDNIRHGRKLEALRQRLQDLGWIEGRNIRIECWWAGDDPGRIRSYAAELVKLKPAVIVCQSGLALPALQRETNTIPIVFTVIVDPLATGFVTSLAHSGGNITGVANAELVTAEKMLEALTEIAPNIDRMTVILNFDQAPQIGMLRAIEDKAPKLRVTVMPAGVRDATDVAQAIEKVAQTANTGMIVLPNPITYRHRDLIIRLSTRYLIPAAYRYRYFVAAGGLVSYGERLDDTFRGAASYVHRILMGEKASDLPVQLPTRLEHGSWRQGMRKKPPIR